MKFSTYISPEDHLDFLRFLDKPVSRRVYIGVSQVSAIGVAFFVVVIVGLLLVIFGAAYVRGEVAMLFADIRIAAIVLLGLILVPFGIWRLRTAFRLRRESRDRTKQVLLDDSALRDGMNIGEVEFEFDNNGVRESLGLVQDTYTWQSFHALRETEKSLFLMIDLDTALIVPKRAASSDDALEDLKSLIESHIGVRA